jgi:heme A synthase
MMTANRFARYAWFVLAYNLFVILWGAFVRASGSGAGCGSHWPLCNGVPVPLAPQLETIIEFAHRMTSGLSLVLVVLLVVWGFRAFAKGHSVRKAVVAVFIFEMVEVLVGAGLVLLGLVARDESVARAIVMPIHLANTFLLLGSTALAAWWASGHAPIRLRGQGILGIGWVIGLVGVMFIGMSGAVTALGDTLFPAGSLIEGMRQDISPTVHVLVRLRVWHPVIAVAIALYVVVYLAPALAGRRPGGATTKLSRVLIGLVAIQLAAGFVNVVLLAPIWMQIIHLALAAAVWVALVLLGAAALSADAPQTQEAAASVAPLSSESRA